MFDSEIPTLRKGLEWAEAEALKPRHRSAWNQMSCYTPAAETQCGSQYCLAGWIVAVRYGVEDPYRADEQSPAAAAGVMAHAGALLGLTEDEEWDLFSATNTIEELREIAERIAGEQL